MCYFQNLADLLLDAIPNDSTDLEPGTRITIHTFENGDVYELEYRGYNGRMAQKGGKTGGYKPKLGYFDFKLHAGERYARLYGFSLVTHYNLFMDLLRNSNLNNCIRVWKGVNPLELDVSLDEKQALLSLAVLMFEQEVNWGNLNFQKNSKFPPNLNNPTKSRPRDMIMGMLLQAFELGIDKVLYWDTNKHGYKTTATFGKNGFGESYPRVEYFTSRLEQLDGTEALLTGDYYNKFTKKVSNKRNNL